MNDPEYGLHGQEIWSFGKFVPKIVVYSKVEG
jgi:hypothetical protein